MSFRVTNKFIPAELSTFLKETLEPWAGRSECFPLNGSSMGKAPTHSSLSGLWPCTTLANESGWSRLSEYLTKWDRDSVVAIEEEGQVVSNLGVSGIAEYYAFKDNVALNAFQESFNHCLIETPAMDPSPLEMEIAAAGRRILLENLTTHIVDSKTRSLFPAILQSLLGDADQTAENTSVAEIVSEDSKISCYIAGLVFSAKALYGKDDPGFVEEYQEYIEMTLNTLGLEKQLENITALRLHLKTPDDYYRRGFLNLPDRPEDAPTGTEFMQKVLDIDLEEFKKNPRQLGSLSKIERENAILKQIELGNVPDFLRRPKAVVIKGPGGEEVKTYVMPDYIAVGSDEDFVRLPLSPILAQAFATKYGLNLPTKTIVEETYLQAGKRVVGPSYSQPEVFEENSAYLDSAGFYLRNSEDIQRQLEGVKPGTLVAGGKKELVVSPLVAVGIAGGRANESIDFYGLYDAERVPAQRTPGHSREAGYKHTEYALGVRFVSPIVVVKEPSGRRRVIRMDQALKDPEVAKIISRVERTEGEPRKRCMAMDGPFDPSTAYRQDFPKDQKLPRGPGSA